ncbi:uncharacterized protein SOCE26_051920 [Sorangium cellulosum]|uniref:Uncharacterized protein n=1 Tax=Sorangium cellulosum TaxID=56 RepID=A0A2L0EWR0_SORCE|nr:uncharacterized protein SOCE26_051920 [Sorangium cellulosum]
MDDAARVGGGERVGRGDRGGDALVHGEPRAAELHGASMPQSRGRREGGLAAGAIPYATARFRLAGVPAAEGRSSTFTQPASRRSKAL